MFTAEKRARERVNGAVSTAGVSTASSADLEEVKSLIQALRDDVLSLKNGESVTGPAEKKSIAQSIADGEEPDEDEVHLLKTEVKALAHAIHQTKVEIAALRNPNNDRDQIAIVSDELDAVVRATEDATNSILESAETIDNVAEQLRSSNDTFYSQLGEQLAEQSMNVYEACNFQDITGQRITKVVNAMKFVEERIQAMITIWGEEDFKEIAPSTTMDHKHDPDAALLSGPQMEGEGISQSEIDALFD
ncbi:unnamed protein product [Chrysoparadoxa australica]